MKYKNKEFDKFNINLGRNVFIPRDNIFMYQKIIKRLGADERNFNLLELGTGTGAISISLAKSFKSAEIVATDISNSALKNAKENAKINKVDNRIDFKKSNWFYNLNEEKYDYIVSNPPYLSKENSQHYQNLSDPKNSLYSKNRGVYDIFEIMKNCRKFMKKKSFLIIEHSHNQTLKIKSFSLLNGLNFINTEKDEFGFNRISIFSNFIK